MPAAHVRRSPFAALRADGRLPPSPALNTARHPPAAGLPDTPGTPTLTNERDPAKLKVVFATPTVDNAGRAGPVTRHTLAAAASAPQGLRCATDMNARLPVEAGCLLTPLPCVPARPCAASYTYDLVRVDSPTADEASFTSVYTSEALPVDATLGQAGDPGQPTLNTFYIAGLPDALYRVRIKAVNPNGVDAVSAWSEAIGTGEAGLVTSRHVAWAAPIALGWLLDRGSCNTRRQGCSLGHMNNSPPQTACPVACRQPGGACHQRSAQPAVGHHHLRAA